MQSCHTFQKRVLLHCFVKIPPTGALFDPQGGDQGQIVCAENIYAPTKDNDIINFLNNLRTILQKENLDDEENIIIRGDFNCPLNPALDNKRWYNVIEEISY